MTNQEMFNRVKSHLLTQNRRSLGFEGKPNSLNHCAYRAINGDKCSIGCLIPDDKYDPKIEGLGFSYNPDFFMSIGVLNKDKSNFDFVRELQRLHDENEPETWVELLNVIAETYNLNA